MCCWERRRSKDVKSVSVCIYRKGDNEDLKNYEYDMNKTFLNAQKERGLASYCSLHWATWDDVD